MSYFQFEHRSVYYEETGAGAPLLLLHGNAASSNMFYEIAKRYEGQRRVILIDFLGHGRSDRLAALPSDLWFYEAEQVLALLREKQYGKVDIVGTSGGALVAVNVALEAPELVGRLIADSFEGERAVRAFTENLKLDRERSKRDENARLFYRYMHGEDWERVVDSDTDAILRHEREIGAFFHRSLRSLRPEILLTGSAEDEYACAGDPAYFEKVYGRMLSEMGHGEMHLFPSGGHPAMLSNQEAFYRLSTAFFAS
ncbi:alpha/beta fold hydrolase [Pseudoflavonifractor sp. BIOML-A6]|jgi:hydrolase|nr:MULTISPECIES: alpha/beta hydrolase [unclassified Pseudoflavonifractor]MTQ97776.1 alpha/beta fold hydrolase [Pseudoflavonifractor sp. BIOML-A16]MTR06763.1 alpha/beta fold hydrolase [Pseudoflavonifractor sp. BIOML-A15]MTR33241.1 alpha/beta fold hydrolase [Pseudoflavonifractor sp. BIOML-A14]MTR74015.1 alpha/beta fold hydrolase [Pseudoflavonifractor sp. BIOML-A18]MTS64785.1 alpha/beta fold hydrolase [Pseudoflavonifractor sp. BIOML-A5]MTS72977.1 alpha/beta fold hydrolase [Pseudoflavonifractor s